MRDKLPLTDDLRRQLCLATAAVSDLAEVHHLYPRTVTVTPTGVLIELHPSRRIGHHLRGVVQCRENLDGKRRRTLIAQHATGCLCRWQEDDL